MREGPATVRKLIDEWRSACGTQVDAGIKAVYERLLRGDKGRRKLAVVALGHWLCRVMLAMLKTHGSESGARRWHRSQRSRGIDSLEVL